MEVVSAIAKAVQEIVKAAGTARENSERCLDLAGRARTVSDILLLDASTASMISSGSGYTMTMRKPSLERLKAALDDALELVESQRRGGFGGGINKLITSGTTAARFQKVEARITACVTDVGLAEQLAARHRARPANTGTGLAPMASLAPEHHHQSSQSATSPLQQHQSLWQHPSLRLPPLQQNQSFQSDESSSQQQRSSQSTTSPLQQRQSLAEQFVARGRRANTGTGSAPMASLAPEHHHQSLQFVPPPSQQDQSFQSTSSLWQHHESFTSSLGSSQQHQSSQSATSPLQQHQSLRQRLSLRLPPSQQNQSFRSEESSSQQQQSSQSTTPPFQQRQSLAEQFAARARHANTGTGSAPMASLALEHHHQSSQFAPRSSQQHRSFQATPSLSQHHESFTSSLGSSQQHQSAQSATSPLQQHQSLRQQLSSQSTPPPLQQFQSLAEQFAARARRANTGTSSAPMASLDPEHHHQSSQFVPPPSQQHQSF